MDELFGLGYQALRASRGIFQNAGQPHQLEPLAKAGVPILSICGSDDPAVPYEENDAALKKRYQALGGDIQVIVEDKGHRHGTREHQKELLEFIRRHTFRTNP